MDIDQGLTKTLWTRGKIDLHMLGHGMLHTCSFNEVQFRHCLSGLGAPLTKGTACRAPTGVGRDGELVVVTHIVPCT